MLKNVAIAGLGVVLLASPLLASADTVAEIQAKINALLAQIKTLQEQLSQAQSSQPIACTADAYQCPDGTWVGRSGPNCQFVCSGQSVQPTPPKKCYVWNRALVQGAAGEDVRELQIYLQSEGYFTGTASGYFGPLTASAVRSWQAQNGIASGGAGWGMFGPRSSAWLQQRCGVPQSALKAVPQSGPAPLSVNFSYVIGGSPADGYSIDFGDGTTGQPTVGCGIVASGAESCPRALTAQHTYQTSGTYRVRLLQQQPWSCPPGMYCATVMPAPKEVAAVSVTVFATQQATFTGSPASGSAPLTTTFTARAEAGNYVIEFGDGTRELVSVPSIVCITTPCVPPPHTTTHTYASPGTYTAIFKQYYACLYTQPQCKIAEPRPLGTVTITVTGGTTSNIQQVNAPGSVTLRPGGIAEVRNKDFYFKLSSLATNSATIDITRVGCWNSFPSDPPAQIFCMIYAVPIPPATLQVGHSVTVGTAATITLTALSGTTATFSVTGMAGASPSISGLDAPVGLSVGQSGTWTVRASAPGSSDLRYSVVWGDEARFAYGAPMASAYVQTQGTFTHTYQYPGTYTPVFTVSNDFGSSQSSAAVIVR